MYIYTHNTLIIESEVSNTMTATQELTETPDWTPEEEVLCAKIMSQIEKGEVNIQKLR